MGEQVKELLANRTTQLAGISHDLRTPLARIRLALGMLSEIPAPDLFERVLRDVEGMNEPIARGLEVSRPFYRLEPSHSSRTGDSGLGRWPSCVRSPP